MVHHVAFPFSSSHSDSFLALGVLDHQIAQILKGFKSAFCTNGYWNVSERLNKSATGWIQFQTILSSCWFSLLDGLHAVIWSATLHFTKTKWI